MNLKNSTNPARQMTWNNKSLTVCSRKELIECIFHLARQVAVAEAQQMALKASEKPAEVYNESGSPKKQKQKKEQ